MTAYWQFVKDNTGKVIATGVLAVAGVWGAVKLAKKLTTKKSA
jgi:hypothetical protein